MNVHIGAIDPRFRSPNSLNAESGAIDPGIRSPDSLNAESGSGGVSRGLGVTLSATIGITITRKNASLVFTRYTLYKRGTIE